jgi:hypothetical protein
MLRHGADSFTTPPKEGELQNVIAIKNPSLSAGFKPAKLEYTCKHEDQYSTENDTCEVKHNHFGT